MLQVLVLDVSLGTHCWPNDWSSADAARARAGRGPPETKC